MKKLKIFMLFLFLIFPFVVSAHRVNIFAWAENGRIFTESEYPDGKRIRNGSIEVFSVKDGKLLLKGQSNEKGEFSFPVPAEAEKSASDLKIVLNAGQGHRNEWLLKYSEYASKPSFSGEKEKARSLEEVKRKNSSGIPFALKIVLGLGIIWAVSTLLYLFKKKKGIKERS